MKKIYLFFLTCILFFAAVQKSLAQFTSGNLAVERLVSTSSNAAPVFMDQYTPVAPLGIVGTASAFPSGSPAPSSAPFNLVESGSASSDGYINLSTTASFLCIPGYNGVNNESGVVSNSDLATIGLMSTTRIDSTPGAGTTGLETNNYRSLASDGTHFWLSGAKGLFYAGSSTAAGAAVTTLKTYTIAIFGGNLYVCDQKQVYGSKVGIYGFTGLPTGTSTATAIITSATNSNVNTPNDFSFTPFGDTCYIADGANGILKFTKSGTTWTYNSNISTGAARSMVVDYSGTNPVIYFTTTSSSGNSILKLTDVGTNPATSTVATASGSNVFYGLAFTPTAITGQPVNLTACSASPATFSVTMNACNANSNYNYQWQSSPNGTTWTNITIGGAYSAPSSAGTGSTGTNISTLTITPSSSATSGMKYRCVVTYMGMYVLTSTAATLTVTPSPTLSSASQASTVCIGNGAIINLSGLLDNSTSTIDYTINGVAQTPITGITSNGTGNASFTSANLSAGNNGQALQVTGIILTSTSGCSQTFTQNVTLSVNQSVTWLGTASADGTDWNNAANWCGGIPNKTVNVVIPTGAPDYPNLNMGNGGTNNITIQSGASVIISGTGVLSIAGSITNSGTLNTTAGSLQLDGSSAQVLDGSWFVNKTIYNLIDSNVSVSLSATVSDTLKVSGVFSFGNINNATFTTNNNLTLTSTSVNTASVADITNGVTNTGNTISGDVTVERYYPSHRSWRLVTAPVSKATLPSPPTINASWQEGSINSSNTLGGIVNPHPGYGTLITGPYSGTAGAAFGFDPGSTSNPSIYYFSGSSWLAPANTNSNPITKYPGYLLFVRGSRQYIITNQYNPSDSANLRVTGALNMGTQPAISGSGFAVIGNPYASTIYFDGLQSRGTGVPIYYYAYDPLIAQTGPGTGVGGWINYFKTGPHTYTAVPDPSDPTDTLFTSTTSSTYVHPVNHDGGIESGQAIMVNFQGAGSLNVEETDKTVGNDDYAFRPASMPLADTVVESFRANLFGYNTDGSISLSDGTLDLFGPQYSDTVNLLEDVLKLGNPDESLALLRDGYRLAIETRLPVVITDTIFYDMSRMEQRNYVLEFEAQNMAQPGLQGILVDNYLGTRTPVNLNGITNIPFTVDGNAASGDSTRFKVVFAPVQGSPLPVTFTSVSAQQQGSVVNVKWSVVNQLNIKEYEVEKSTDGVSFGVVGTAAATGNSQSSVSYNWPDANAVAGTNYYRIISIGNDGTVSYSQTVQVEIGAGTPSITVYPNPVQDGVIGLQFSNMPAGKYNIRLLDAIGQVMIEQEITLAAGSSSQQIKFDPAMAKGVYHLEVTGPDNYVNTLKVIY